jgi:hypothetical protein
VLGRVEYVEFCAVILGSCKGARVHGSHGTGTRGQSSTRVWHTLKTHARIRWSLAKRVSSMVRQPKENVHSDLTASGIILREQQLDVLTRQGERLRDCCGRICDRIDRAHSVGALVCRDHDALGSQARRHRRAQRQPRSASRSMPIDQSSRLRIGDAKVHRKRKLTDASDPSFSISSATDQPCRRTSFSTASQRAKNAPELYSAFYSTFYLRD